jgi:UrcA family protein
MKTFISRAAGATLAAAALAAPALAQDAPVFEFTVDRASLKTEREVAIAYQRLESEAGRYCRALDLGGRNATARCRYDVVAGVVEAAGDDRLADHHRAQVRENRALAAAG